MITGGYTFYKILQELWTASTWRWSATCTIQCCQLHWTSTDHDRHWSTNVKLTPQLFQTEKDFKRHEYLETVWKTWLSWDSLLSSIQFLGSENAVESAEFSNLELSTWPAGWRSSSTRGIKNCLLEAQISQLLPGTITTGHQVPKVRDFVIFATLIYPWWITCASAIDAPWQDLNLFHKLWTYKVVNLFKASPMVFDRPRRICLHLGSANQTLKMKTTKH